MIRFGISLFALWVAACTGTDDRAPEGPSDDASVSSDGRSSDGQPDRAVHDGNDSADADAFAERDGGRADVSSDGPVGSDASFENDTGIDGEGRVDARPPLDGSETEGSDIDAGLDISSDARDEHRMTVDSALSDRNWTFDAASGCATVLPLPPASSTEARLWFVSSQIADIQKARSRGDVIYGAANPPFKLDVGATSLCRLPGPSSSAIAAIDVLAPEGTSSVVVAFGAPDAPREIRTSLDDGQTWTVARQPASTSSIHSFPCSLASLRASNGAVPRMFATHGGTTLDVSDNGGLDWYRAIEGGNTPAEGFTVDTSGQALWYVSEAVLDRVGAYWIPVSATGSLASSWNFQRVEGWDSNGVYIAQPDPFDPGAIFLGGEGRLGRLTLVGGQVTVALPWSRSPFSDSGQPYTYVTALWADPGTKDHVVWGGGPQGGGSAEVLESTQGGANAQPIPLEGSPAGTVRSIQYLSGLRKLALLLARPDTSLAVYLIDR